MKNKCIRAIEQYHMLCQGDTVVVGVSGGADSMALLHFLHTHQQYYGIKVIAAHFNHCIRGNEADRDMEFVRIFCEMHRIDFVCEKTDVPKMAAQRKMSAEACGRELRYAFLQAVAPGARIATAHTTSDSCESFLFNFARGTGLQGLCGIPPCRENIIRPCILCSAADTRTYCTENGITWCEDSTNASDAYSRNYIRLHTVPSLRAVNRMFEDNAQRCMQILRDENEFLNGMTLSAFESCRMSEDSLSMECLYGYHKVIVNRVLLHYARSIGCTDVSMNQVARIAQMQEGEIITLSNAVRLTLGNGILKPIKNQKVAEERKTVAVASDGNFQFYDFFVNLTSKVYTNEILNTYKFIVDADKIKNPILRTRQAGDKIRLRNRNCTKTLKQLFTENKIDPALRSTWPILADDDGIICVAEFGVDESRLPDQYTKKVIIIEWSKQL